YRRDDIPALGAILGLGLLAAWVGTSAVAILNWTEVRPQWALGVSDTPTPSVIATLMSAMLIGLVPIAASARLTVDWRRASLLTGQAPTRRPLPPPWLTVR